MSPFAVNVLVKLYYVSCRFKVFSSWRTVLLFVCFYFSHYNCSGRVAFVSYKTNPRESERQD